MSDRAGVTLRYEGQRVPCRPGETVLEAFERHGIAVASSCRTGTCQTCLLQATDGPIPAAAQAGLKPAWVALGLLKACTCRPEADLALAAPGEGVEIEGTLADREWLDDRVVRIRVRTREPLSFRPGQFVHLVRSDGLSRPYSIASLPSEGDLELHVRVVQGGRMSPWLAREIAPGDPLRVRGPAGDCIYLDDEPDRAMLLVGVGTGIAPMWGVLRDALSRGHRGPIQVVHAAASGRGLYLLAALKTLAEAHPTVAVHGVALAADGVAGVTEANLSHAIPEIAPEPAELRAYLCGDPEIVHALRKQLFLAGASLARLHADAFVGAPTGR